MRMNSRPEMTLEKWTLRSGTKTASSGDFLIGTTEPEIEIAVGHRDGVPRKISLVVIRDGKVILEGSKTTPAVWKFTDDGLIGKETFYRAMLKDSQGGRLVTNPIFLSDKPR